MNSLDDQPATGKRRILELDSVRGLAALSVLLHHILLTWPTFTAENRSEALPVAVRLLKYSPLHIFWAGHEAVILFFVLSGFVLFLPFLDKRAPPARLFILKRVCRIWLPCLFCVLAVVVINRLGFDRGPGQEAPPTRRFTPSDILGSAVLIAWGGDAVYAPLWSLIHEMRVSLIFPVLAAFILHVRAWAAIAVSIGISLMAFVCFRVFQEHGATRTDSILQTLGYLPAFMTGMVLAKYQKQAVAAYGALSPAARVGVFAAAVLLYTAPYGIFLRLTKMQGFLCGWATVAGAAAFIALVLASPLPRGLLLTGPIKFLGRVSYSLYLLHGIGLALALHFLAPIMPRWGVMAIGGAASIALAAAGYEFIEAPSIRLAQKIGPARPQGSAPVARVGAP